jgi:small subunit ribosomal protein S4e
MAHLKRYAMPKAWPLGKKLETFVIRPVPGPHALAQSIPLQIVLRDMLKVAENASEAKMILKEGKVLVDKSVRKEPKFSVGLMDIIDLPDLNQYLRVVPSKKGIELEKISKEDSNVKLCRINSKSVIRGGIQQLNLHDGRNILAGKKSSYKPGDSIIIGLPGQEILKHYSFEKGTPAFINAGRNIGAHGVIKKVKRKKSMLEKSTVLIESNGKEIQTLIEYVFPGDLKAKIKHTPKPQASKPAAKTRPAAKKAKPKPAAKPKTGAKKGGKS